MSLFQPLAARFERLVDPYPETAGHAPPGSFFAFLWRCADGVRPHLVAVTLFTAGIAAAEALLFSLMASLVDWLSTVKPAELWDKPQPVVLLLLGVLAVSIVLATFTVTFFSASSANLTFPWIEYVFRVAAKSCA